MSRWKYVIGQLMLALSQSWTHFSRAWHLGTSSTLVPGCYRKLVVGPAFLFRMFATPMERLNHTRNIEFTLFICFFNQLHILVMITFQFAWALKISHIIGWLGSMFHAITSYTLNVFCENHFKFPHYYLILFIFTLQIKFTWLSHEKYEFIFFF